MRKARTIKRDNLAPPCELAELNQTTVNSLNMQKTQHNYSINKQSFYA